MLGLEGWGEGGGLMGLGKGIHILGIACTRGLWEGCLQ